MTTNAKRPGRAGWGSATEHPCTYPATEPLMRIWSDDEPVLCAYHAATQPLAEESGELGVCLELVQVYLRGARRHPRPLSGGGPGAA